MKFLLFGSGDYYDRYKNWFVKDEVVGILDNDVKKQNSIIDGLRVYAPERICELKYDAIVILSFYVEEMKKQLLGLDVDQSAVFHFFDLHKLIDISAFNEDVCFYGISEKELDACKNDTILLLSADLYEHSGPARTLIKIAEIIKEYGFNVAVGTMIDGSLKNQLLDNNISVIVDSKLQIASMKDISWTHGFKRILCNTVGYYQFILQRDLSVPVIWWLHDSEFFMKGIDVEELNDIDKTNLQVFTVGKVPDTAIKAIWHNIETERLIYGIEKLNIPDIELYDMASKCKKYVSFVVIGYIEYRKGQDVLIEALKLLPDNIRNHTKIRFLGSDKSLLAQNIKKDTECMHEVEFAGLVSESEKWKTLSGSDVLICPSRQDPMPASVTEAMMFGIPCIVSDAVGQEEFIIDRVNGLKFTSENAAELAGQMEWCINNKDRLKEIGEKSREIYFKIFSMKVFKQEIINKIINPLKFKARTVQWCSMTVAIYGLSVETEKALTKLKVQYNIVGLLDGFRETGEMYGMPIISLDKCIDYQVEMIIVVARPGSCRAIYNRIGGFCRKHGIKVIDIRGNALDVKKDVKFDFSGLSSISKAELMSNVAESDIVSLDLFDTLIMRCVPLPEDVFELVEIHIKKAGYQINDFAKKRLGTEKSLSQAAAPRLVDIYAAILRDENGYSEGEIEKASKELADIEFSVDCKLVVPRREMVAILLDIRRNGKPVYITSDSYYSKNRIQELLCICGIDAFENIIVSCEYGVSKTQGLYDVLRKDTSRNFGCDKLTTGKILHIGDDVYSDIECAEKTGISTYRIYSGYELFDEAGCFGLKDMMKGIPSKIKAGMLIAEIFNSPFLFEDSERKVTVSSAYDIGYLFMAPIIADFTIWFRNKVKQYDLKNIWFGARDGYLIKRLYDILESDNNSVYFLTSRIAAIRAGILDETDLQYVAEMKFSGSVRQQLKERFGISIDSSGGNDTDDNINNYKDIIINRSRTLRDNFQKYINTIQVLDSGIAFFDFVAKGTTQMFLKRFVPNHIKGLYFMQLEKDNMSDKNIDVESFYDMSNDEKRAIYEDYYILETILTSDNASVGEYDDKGRPVYLEETRDEKTLNCFREIQRGVEEYFKKYIYVSGNETDDDNQWLDKQFDEALLGLIHNINIDNNEFIDFQVEDKFFNRMTDMKCLI